MKIKLSLLFFVLSFLTIFGQCSDICLTSFGQFSDNFHKIFGQLLDNVRTVFGQFSGLGADKKSHRQPTPPGDKIKI